MIEMKPFTFSDWQGWAGAEEFPATKLIDVVQPLIGEMKINGWEEPSVEDSEITVIADRTGISLHGAEGWLHLPAFIVWSPAIARAVINELEGKTFSELLDEFNFEVHNMEPAL